MAWNVTANGYSPQWLRKVQWGELVGEGEQICFSHKELTEVVTRHWQGDISLCFQCEWKWISLDQKQTCEFLQRQQLDLCPAVSRSGRLRKGWSLWDLFEEKSMEKLAWATSVELQQVAQHQVRDELQAGKVNSTFSMLTDKREKGDEIVVVEANRFNVCFQSGEIKHTLV